MVQYIYFVKCPNCEDEHFDFFDEAKEFALGCLGNKPIITQVEVCRNDFGECTDSSDLGTIWSWEDEACISEDDPAVSVFAKSDFAEYNSDADPEFDALDNSVEFEPILNTDDTTFHSDDSLAQVPDNFRKPVTESNAVLAATKAPKDSDYIIASKHANGSYSFLGYNYKMTTQLDKAMSYSGKADAEYDIKYAEDQSGADRYVYDPFFITTFGEAKKLVAERNEYVKQRDAKVAARKSFTDEIRDLARKTYDQGKSCPTYEEFKDLMLANGYSEATKYLYYGVYRDEIKQYKRELNSKSSTTGFDESCTRKPIPEGMTIEQLVEAMEENEDTVECVCCQELYPKEECKYDEKHGWICPDCIDEVVECTWCGELYNRSECRREVDLGWLCSRCEAAIKSRGETLTFRESSYWDYLDEE